MDLLRIELKSFAYGFCVGGILATILMLAVR